MSELLMAGMDLHSLSTHILAYPIQLLAVSVNVIVPALMCDAQLTRSSATGGTHDIF